MNYNTIPLINDKANHNYIMEIDGHRSFIDYRLKDDKVYLVHTQVPPELEGQGLAAALVEKVLLDIETRHLKAVAMCAYIKFFLKQHPEWNRVVA